MPLFKNDCNAIIILKYNKNVLNIIKYLVNVQIPHMPESSFKPLICHE